MEAKESTGNAKTVTCPVTGETWVVRKTDVELCVFRENLSAFRATRALHPIVDWLLQCLVDIPFASDADSTPQDVFGRLLTFLLHVRMVVWESSDDLTTTDSTLAMFSTILNTFVANHKSIPIDDLTCSHLDHTPCLFPKNTKKNPPAASETTILYTFTRDLYRQRTWSIQKRYSEFQTFHTALIHAHHVIKDNSRLLYLSWMLELVLQLPFPKKLWFASDKASLILERQVAFEAIVSALLRLHWLCDRRHFAELHNPLLAACMKQVFDAVESFLQFHRGPNDITNTVENSESSRHSASAVDISDVLDHDNECVICWEKLPDDDDEDTNATQTLICGHTFHRTCMDDWLNHRPICPICCRQVAPDRPQQMIRLRQDLWTFWQAFGVIFLITLCSVVVGFYMSPLLLEVVDQCLAI
ncbi:unnamed protein product [Aphanomyces euteiches]|uniref:RING-type domain-containing protein n=1 Tax=Aphanomyces euteiches TaxID=100861 RepID=A0A6G0WNU4_9STRA|nr:hypothetical protein Ae201684_013345 [Aphanomyces euteiches]KAH9064848.1 hypothetical protein Ae201684P_003629 [Aphanomyces euteiches]